jgi:hypothetical protein
MRASSSPVVPAGPRVLELRQVGVAEQRLVREPLELELRLGEQHQPGQDHPEHDARVRVGARVVLERRQDPLVVRRAERRHQVGADRSGQMARSRPVSRSRSLTCGPSRTQRSGSGHDLAPAAIRASGQKTNHRPPAAGPRRREGRARTACRLLDEVRGRFGVGCVRDTPEREVDGLEHRDVAHCGGTTRGGQFHASRPQRPPRSGRRSRRARPPWPPRRRTRRSSPWPTASVVRVRPGSAEHSR